MQYSSPQARTGGTGDCSTINLMDITALSSSSLLFYSLFSPSLQPFYLLHCFYSLILHTHIYICFSSPHRNSLMFTIRSILDHPNGFQLPGLNLKADEVDGFPWPSLHPKKHGDSESTVLYIQFIKGCVA